MNCTKAERWLLLEASGELPARRRRALERHVGACAGCAGLRAALPRLAGLARTPDAEAAPNAFAVARILAAIETPAPAALPGSGWGPALRLGTAALATAAAVTLAFGLGVRLGVRPATGPALARSGGASGTAFDAVDVQMDLLDDELASLAADVAAAGADDLDTLARELLAIEGKTI